MQNFARVLSLTMKFTQTVVKDNEECSQSTAISTDKKVNIREDMNLTRGKNYSKEYRSMILVISNL